MADMLLTWPVPGQGGQGNWGFRGLAHVARRAFTFAPDPTPGLLEPHDTAGHRVRRVSIPLGDHAMPGYMFTPRRWNGGTLALVHGVSAEMIAPYWKWLAAFLKGGYQVMTFELDGHGLNPRALCCPGIDEDVPAAVAYMRTLPDVDPDRIGLIGVSLGGACILNALGQVGPVKAIATVSTPHNIALTPLMMHLEALGTFNVELLPFALEASVEAMLEFLTKPMRWHGQGHFDFLDPRAEAAIRDLIAYLDPLSHAGDRADVPVLVMNGEWDQLAPAWQAKEIHDRVRGAKALSIVPRRNHFTIMGTPQAIDEVVGWFEAWV